MTKTFTIILDKNDSSTNTFKYNRILIVLLSFIFILLILTITFAILWTNNIHSFKDNKSNIHYGTIAFSPLLPNDGKYIQWTILQLNDVYEMLPLDQGRKGGLARVAHIRQLLLEEKRETFTILSGDFLSPSALGQSIVDGRRLNGRQMIESLNILGLDFVTFGNHEFDLTENELISRMNESRFEWISSNVFQSKTNKTFSISIPYKLISIEKIKIIFIGLTIDDNKPYIDIINKTLLIQYVKQFIKSLSDIKYDVLIALTHLDIQTDIKLAENIPQIDLILGGHEHENYYLLRGSKYTSISKADANAFSVYIHRCAFNLYTKQFRVYSTLTKITSEIAHEPKTDEITNYWYNRAMKGFEQMGFNPNERVSCLPEGVILDGRASSVRNFETLLTEYDCQGLIKTTNEDSTIIAIVNSGSIRIDDILKGNISQYDILRVLPFQNNVISLSLSGKILGDILTDSIRSKKDNGMFLYYCGIETADQGKTWLINGTNILENDVQYRIATTDYAREHTNLNDPTVSVLHTYNITQTKSLINYLKKVYPPC